MGISIVKIDIEQYEWAVLHDIIKNNGLNGVRNFVIEFHLAVSSNYMHLLKSKQQISSYFEAFHFCSVL